MIVVGIVLAIVIALMLALVIVGVGGTVTKQARKLIESGHITDTKRAYRILRSLGSMPEGMKTRETEELYDKLKLLLEQKEAQT